MRVRLTGSVYHSPESAGTHLYSGDRAGSRYYYALENVLSSAGSQFRSGRYDPGFKNKLTSIMVNPFVKYQGLEFFGVFETSTGATGDEDDRTWTQLSGEAMYRIGEGASDLSQLALTLGFSSHSHLSEVFRRELGTPPSSLRSDL